MWVQTNAFRDVEDRICRLAELDDFTPIREDLIEATGIARPRDYGETLARFEAVLRVLRCCAVSSRLESR